MKYIYIYIFFFQFFCSTIFSKQNWSDLMVNLGCCTQTQYTHKQKNCFNYFNCSPSDFDLSISLLTVHANVPWFIFEDDIQNRFHLDFSRCSAEKPRQSLPSVQQREEDSAILSGRVHEPSSVPALVCRCSWICSPDMCRNTRKWDSLHVPTSTDQMGLGSMFLGRSW